MASAAKDDDDGLVQGINVTPLVDVCLVLLVIMMVTAKAIVQQQVPLDLPQAAKSQLATVVFQVDVLSNGDVTVDSAKLDKVEQVLPKAKEALAKNSDLRVNIRADASVPHGKVMRVVDLLKQAGVSKIAFGISPVAPEPGSVP
jgi:biopolymer transport protein ExbD